MATFKRAKFIAETIDSLIPQLRDGMELVIVDGASPDDTHEVVESYAARHPAIRYYRESVNSGIDGDYDKAVGYASGEYCWLVPDDDLLAPGSVDRVWAEIADSAPDLVVVDAEVRDITLKRVLKPKRLNFDEVRRYGPENADALLKDTGDALTFIGCVIIRRDVWMARERQKYYGTVFIHVGVIFQNPLLANVVVIPQPLVVIRLGNAMWTPKAFEIWMFKWPELVWSFEGYTAEARRSVVPRYPFRDLKTMLLYRANGAYSISEYRNYFGSRDLGSWRQVLLLIAFLPGRLLNFLFLAYIAARGRAGGMFAYVLVRSRFTNRASRLLLKLTGAKNL
jgi:glycosyltransferase involved in cell wall biosynthesis